MKFLKILFIIIFIIIPSISYAKSGKGEIKLSKQIISLYKNGFIFNQSFFEDKEQVIIVAEEISEYGDIPSVRRAIKMVNNQFRINIKCKISEHIQESLDQKAKIKDLSKPKFNVKYGKFKIEF